MLSSRYYLNENYSLKRYKLFYMNDPIFIGSFYHCIKILYFTEKVQAAKFQFSLQRKTGLYLQVDVSTSIDVLGFELGLGNPKAGRGAKKQQKLCDRVNTPLC